MMKGIIARGVKKKSSGGYAETHFDPDYDPWDQRLCIMPYLTCYFDKEGRHRSKRTIETFTGTGAACRASILRQISLSPATGLVLKIMDGVTLVVDGEPVDLSKKMAYKGMMYNDVPNLAQAFGSLTLRGP